MEVVYFSLSFLLLFFTFVCAQSLRYVRPCDPQAYQVPLSMEFHRQEYWSELPFPPLGGSS